MFSKNKGSLYVEALIAMVIISILSVMMFTGFVMINKTQKNTIAEYNSTVQFSNIVNEIRYISDNKDLNYLNGVLSGIYPSTSLGGFSKAGLIHSKSIDGVIYKIQDLGRNIGISISYNYGGETYEVYVWFS